MSRPIGPVTAALTAGVLALALAGCNANDKSATSGSASSGAAAGVGATATPKQGGTFYVLSSSKEIHFDPAKSQNLGTSSLHLITRSLTSWQTDPIADTRVVGDLATDTGTTSDGGKTWTYHLKSGLKYADGSPITSKDVKFGIERSFDAQLQGGLSYHKSLLVGGDTYKGPSSGADLASVETPDDSTIVFHLTTAFADWPWVASMPAFAPIPAGKGMGIPAYDHTPPSSGPYQVDTYTVGSKVVLKRNPNWDRATDQTRLGAPDVIEYDMGQNAQTSAQRLVDDQGNDKNAAGAAVTASIIPKINADPALKARTTVSSSGALNYLAMNTSRPALKDLATRQAIEYAINKQQIQTIAGGPTYGGAIASTIIPPGIAGYSSYNLYQAPPTGDTAKAQSTLGATKVGSLKLLISSDSQTDGQVASSIQQDLKKIGIDVQIVAQDTDTESATQSDVNGDYDLTLSGWQADYPGAYAMIQPLFASDQIGNGNYNFSHTKDAGIDSAITAAVTNTDASAAAQAWGALDQQIMKNAPIVPLYYGHQAYLNGSNTTGTYIPSFPSYPNVLIQGLKQ